MHLYCSHDYKKNGTFIYFAPSDVSTEFNSAVCPLLFYGVHVLYFGVCVCDRVPDSAVLFMSSQFLP